MYRITETVKHLLIINVLMFVGTMVFKESGLFYDWFALYFPKNPMFKPWQIFTHMFMHGNFPHILFNMFALWMFGVVVEQQLGSKKFIFFYLSSGLGAALFQLGVYYFQYVPLEQNLLHSGITSDQIQYMLNNNKVLEGISQSQLADLRSMFDIYGASMVGASGCIMGVLVAFGMLNPEAKLMLIFLPIPIKAKYFIPGILAIELISGLRGQSIFGFGNIAHFAHIGGALTGFLIMWFWKKNQFNNNRWDR